ncbi:unnamed protein product [Cladocopium goreaui]|uniref:Uncharacterized protein n=1 Tax=Cladocopium goreaui TaxID=2562237 RepID=A0A9P1DUS6_9DINO|nr:unnamed protein product [Cladocopium goreaui]
MGDLSRLDMDKDTLLSRWRHLTRYHMHGSNSSDAGAFHHEKLKVFMWAVDVDMLGFEEFVDQCRQESFPDLCADKIPETCTAPARKRLGSVSSGTDIDKIRKCATLVVQL